MKRPRVQIWQNSSKNKDSLRQSNVMEISRAEVSVNLLGFDYCNCNGGFTHVNTITPEYRRSPLKRKTNEELDEEYQEYEVVFNYDPNEDRVI